jgi:hypothetical protein
MIEDQIKSLQRACLILATAIEEGRIDEVLKEVKEQFSEADD